MVQTSVALQFRIPFNHGKKCLAARFVLITSNGWNHADWGRIVFSKESRFQLCPYDNRIRVWIRPGSLPILLSLMQATQAQCCYELSYSLLHTSLDSQIARSVSKQAFWGYDGQGTAPTREY
ncbi:hypothetical protein TNCV_3026741 [Trichonephila clavipes]|nr:hypothetical protein TNCV_3026741 [Trichonephila clavipes]